MKFALTIGASLLACASISISNSEAHAQEAKSTAPVSTVPNSGTAIFDGHVFEYRITDRGVRTNGHLFPGPAVINSERNYLLSYHSTAEISQHQLWASADVLHADASARCKELANAELDAVQKSDAPDNIKKAAVQRTHLIRPPIMKTFDPTTNYGTFICNAIVNIQLR